MRTLLVIGTVSLASASGGGAVGLQHDDQRSWTSASVVTPSANRQPELSMCPWHLALAAYNSGERNIARILETGGAEDFWEMRRRG